MEFKHTKGKWTVRGNFKALEVFSTYGTLCAIARQSSIDSEIDSEAEANAKLIATAPEMLQLLQKIYNSQQVEGNAEIWAEIKTLIKKATE